MVNDPFQAFQAGYSPSRVSFPSCTSRAHCALAVMSRKRHRRRSGLHTPRRDDERGDELLFDYQRGHLTRPRPLGFSMARDKGRYQCREAREAVMPKDIRPSGGRGGYHHGVLQRSFRGFQPLS